MSDSEIEMMVDVVLNDFDTNGDGLIDYAEYIAKADREWGLLIVRISNKVLSLETPPLSH